MRINRFHKMRGEILKPIHYLLFYTQLNHYTTNNYCMFFFSHRLSPIRTSFMTDLETESIEYHEEWQKMNDFLKDIQSFRRELNDIIVGWKEVLSCRLTLNELSQR